MLLGAMNNPHMDLIKEVKWIIKRFDFLDLTLEMPKGFPENVKDLKEVIGNTPVVGHTGWYLPIGAPLKEMRLYAIQEFERCLGIFEKLGVDKVNIHLENWDGYDEKSLVDANVWTIRKLVMLARGHGVEVMAENTGGVFSRPDMLIKVFEKVPRLKLHLDIGHANIGFKNNQSPGILRYLSKKLVHVHISDNNGRGDEHQAIGRGNINWQKMFSLLKLTGYDETITLEVFSSPKDRVNSKIKVRKIWDDL